jgi:Domain of Unknown Function (DUF1080)/FG-GAP-like repeat
MKEDSMLRGRSLIVLAAIAAGTLAPYAHADGPNFRADYKLEGSSLDGWKKLGAADWNVENGTITGTPKSPTGGWLMLDKSLSDVALYANVYCSSGCRTGFLLRAAKTPSGWSGIYVSMTPDDLGAYAVTLDASGIPLSRHKLEKTDSEGGLASPMSANMPDEIRKFIAAGGLKSLPLPAGINFPDLELPSNAYRPGDWNAMNLVLYGDMIDPALGAGGFIGPRSGLDRSAVPPDVGGYGPIALYVGGTGKVQLKDVQYRDLDVLKIPKEYLSPEFKEQHLTGYYSTWGATVADVNKDGIPDIIAGPYYYLGPDYTEAREFFTPTVYNPGTEYPQKSMVSLAYDFTGDGWPDILVMSGQAGVGTATLYVNPHGESRHWESHVVVKPIGNEDTLLADIDGDGLPEIIHAGNQSLQYSKPDPKNPTGTWVTTTISKPGPWGSFIGHGLGVGDINGDGRMDFVSAYGWFEQPPRGSGQKLWTYHPEAFGRWGHTQGGAGGAQLGIYDVNGDGLNDVVTSLEGHGYGLAWYEQKRDAAGKISFVKHVIMDNFLTENAGGVTFTEPHATEFADMNGDGIPDLITGKRAMSHLFDYGDPDPFGPAVLYVYTVVRDPAAPGGAKFVPTLVHNMSGVGSHFAVTDLNGDGRPDIVTSGIFGTFVFFNQMKPQAHAANN